MPWERAVLRPSLRLAATLPRVEDPRLEVIASVLGEDFREAALGEGIRALRSVSAFCEVRLLPPDEAEGSLEGV